jgi:hypothetical protein
MDNGGFLDSYPTLFMLYRDTPDQVPEQSGSASSSIYQTVRSARTTLQGIEFMHMIKKSQMVFGDSQVLSVTGPFYSLAI